MGGEKSQYYKLFLSLCAEAYNILRKSSNLLLNLMLLMIHSNIPQLVGEKDLLEVSKIQRKRKKQKARKRENCLVLEF
jgi:hypothetical protein